MTKVGTVIMMITTYVPEDGSAPFIVDKRVLTDDKNVAVVHHNPYDNIEGLAHYFFERCMEAKGTPYGGLLPIPP